MVAIGAFSITQATSDTAKVGPKVIYLAVDEKWFREIVVRDEHLATVRILSELRPAV